MSNTTRSYGTVEFFNNAKGWGVITSEGESFFFHHTSITDTAFFPAGKPKKFRTLKANQPVSFEAVDKRDDSHYMRSAINVQIVSLEPVNA